MTGRASSEIGELMVERRDELGLSSIDVADGLGRPITLVRSWERGASLPDTDDVEGVARVLRLPRSLVAEALRRSLAEESGPVEFETDATESIEVDESPAPGVVPPPIPMAPSRQSVLTTFLSSPLEALKGAIRRAQETARAPTAQTSYMEDSRQLTTYRMRAALTVGGILVLIVMLRWAFSGLGDSLGEVWDTLTGAL